VREEQKRREVKVPRIGDSGSRMGGGEGREKGKQGSLGWDVHALFHFKQ